MIPEYVPPGLGQREHRRGVQQRDGHTRPGGSQGTSTTSAAVAATDQRAGDRLRRARPPGGSSQARLGRWRVRRHWAIRPGPGGIRSGGVRASGEQAAGSARPDRSAMPARMRRPRSGRRRRCGLGRGAALRKRPRAALRGRSRSVGLPSRGDAGISLFSTVHLLYRRRVTLLASLPHRAAICPGHASGLA